MMHLTTSLTETRMICTITGVGEADTPAASSHPDSSKPVTKGRKICINLTTWIKMAILS